MVSGLFADRPERGTPAREPIPGGTPGRTGEAGRPIARMQIPLEERPGAPGSDEERPGAPGSDARLNSMSLKERLRADLAHAIKARDEVRTATLRMALAAITTEEVSGATARTLTDEDIIKVLLRERKKRDEAAEAFAAAGRQDLADRERAEAEVIAAYLPEPLSDDELRAAVREAIAEVGAVPGPEGARFIGPVMKLLTARLSGRADGSRIAAEVRQQLAG